MRIMQDHCQTISDVSINPATGWDTAKNISDGTVNTDREETVNSLADIFGASSGKCQKQTIKVEPSRTDRSPVDFSEIPRCWTTHLVK